MSLPQPIGFGCMVSGIVMSIVDVVDSFDWVGAAEAIYYHRLTVKNTGYLTRR
jgi:hypothetical protein